VCKVAINKMIGETLSGSHSAALPRGLASVFRFGSFDPRRI
jgi:hypothetical protein